MSRIETAKCFIEKALELMAERASEVRVRDNFTSYLRGMYPDNPKWVSYHIDGAERHVHLVRNNRSISGFIDNCIDCIAIEYEKNLSVPSVYEEGFRQVKEYCAALVREGIPVGMIQGVLSDTLNWKVFEVVPDGLLDAGEYSQENIVLREVASIHISQSSDREASDLLLFLQTYLGRIGGRRITARRLADDFGLKSGYSRIYREAIRGYVERKKCENPQYYKMIGALWTKFVDGHSGLSGNDDSYISEFYISIVAKILCANLVSKRALSSTPEELCDIVNGRYFENKNIENFVDYDYFGWLNADAGELADTLRRIQDDLKVYDFEAMPEEDMFGELMVQLSDRTQRILLGQELTPRWLANQLVGKVISGLDGQDTPRFVDMCCGSGSMIVETIRQTDAMLSRDMPPGKRSRILVDCISGFDVDPLAVILSKINWLVTIYGRIDRSCPIFIPIYHADSLFAENLMGRTREGKTALRLFDKLVEVPSCVISVGCHNVFDMIVDKCYDYIHIKVEERDFMDAMRSSLASAVPDISKLDDVCKFSYSLYKVLFQLNAEGRNGIWAFVLKNLLRPNLIRGRYNGIVSNTPWLAMSKIGSNPYKDSLRTMAKHLGINPTDSSFLHLELATVFLLNSIDKYLCPGGLFGCILPDSVMTGKQHEKFRDGRFAKKRVEAGFYEIWELPTDTFKNRGIALFGRKEPYRKKPFYPGRRYRSKDEYSATRFSVVGSQNRTVWTDAAASDGIAGGNRYKFKQGADVMPRCFYFFTMTEEKGGGTRLSSIREGDKYSYFLNGMKKGKKLFYECCGVPPSLVKSVLVSSVLTPFRITEPPQAVLPIERKDGEWGEIGPVAQLSYPRSFINLMAAIRRDYKAVASNSSMFDRTLNMRNKLKLQKFETGQYLVLYGAGGANICSACLKIGDADKLVVDQTLYWTTVPSEDEAMYLSGMLNCPLLNEIISAFQTQGAFGKRHVHTLPLSYIPRFDPNDGIMESFVQTVYSLCSVLGKAISVHELNPNAATLVSRRRKVVRAMQNMPSYAGYVEFCKKILARSAGKADECF